MNTKSLLKAAALGAGLTILLIGIAVAQTTPPAPAPPAPAPQVSAPPAAAAPAASPTMTRREINQACRAEIKSDLRGGERREAMRECVRTKRENRRAEQQKLREERRSQYLDCRKEFAEQRLTEKERRDSIEGCLAKKSPRFAKMLECRKQAEEKKFERGTREFRQHMRSCIGPRSER